LLKAIANNHPIQDVRPFKKVGIFGFSSGKVEKVRGKRPVIGVRVKKREG
jgi:hypothetical protein